MINGVTSLNTSFLIEFAFVFSEIYLDYYWVLSFLWQFYYENDILDPIFVEINCMKALIEVLGVIFSQIEYGLCFWYVDKNVLANCKLLFDIEEL